MKAPKFLFPACCLALVASWAVLNQTTIPPLDVTLPTLSSSGDDDETEDGEDGGFNILKHKLFVRPKDPKAIDPEQKRRYEAVLDRYGG